jgi:1-pyrroline-5-carboxylate dehydrogenase
MFKLTYATMFNPPEEVHERFEVALKRRKAGLGAEVAMFIDGRDVVAEEKFEDRSPIDTGLLLAMIQKGTGAHAEAALAAAHGAFPLWSRTPWRERVALLRAAAGLIEQRLFDIGAVMSLEVGKNRMESLGDAQETADLILYACRMMEENEGFTRAMGSDPLSGFTATNTSVLRPYGVWLVISPFNFPAALTGGPMGAALAAGNTVVAKPATDTAWTVRLLIDCFRDAGLPDGVVNFLTGPGDTLGRALVGNAGVDGVTFTGSQEVGMGIYRSFAQGPYVRPLILEMGGKNPVIVSRNADLDEAASGIVRSAFGLQGQKCSAVSRILVEEPVREGLSELLKERTEKLAIGDPTERGVFFGPVINGHAYEEFKQFTADLSRAGKVLAGGAVLTEGGFAKGWFCAPTLVANVPFDHPLWKREMFLPIATVGGVQNLVEGMRIANDVGYGLTAGFYGSAAEAEWFFDGIEAGVTYANRPQGATTGAWPGFQPFGGWKGSGSTGKNAGGLYYVQLYMREQIRTLVERSGRKPSENRPR